jgi:hypothetical protein
MKGNAKGGDPRKNRRKGPRRRDQEAPAQPGRKPQGEGPKTAKGRKSIIASLTGEGKYGRRRAVQTERPRWVQPEPPAIDIVPAMCALCDKPIKDFSTALSDPGTGRPAHFDCAIGRIAEGESLGKGDAIGYIGAGRFGVIHHDNPQNPKKFTIKKILEWEREESRSDWRVALCEHFSIT